MCIRVVERYSICRCLYYKHSVDRCAEGNRKGHSVQERSILVGYLCPDHSNRSEYGHYGVVNQMNLPKDIPSTETFVPETGSRRLENTHYPRAIGVFGIDSKIETDSGYGSNNFSTTGSVMSDFSDRGPLDHQHDIVQELMAIFLQHILESRGIRQTLKAVLPDLQPALLDQKLGQIMLIYCSRLTSIEGYSLHTSAKRLIERHRSAIASSLRRLCESTSIQQDLYSRLHETGKVKAEVTREEMVQAWTARNYGMELEIQPQFEEQAEDGDDLLTDLATVRQFLISSPPFIIMLEEIRALYFDGDSMLKTVKNGINSICSKLTDIALELYIIMDWDPVEFLADQFGSSDINAVDLARTIVISGSVLYARATTSGDYLNETWPGLGPLVLKGMIDAMDGETAQTSKAIYPITEEGNINDIRYQNNKCNARVYGAPQFIITVVQVIAWMGAALRFGNGDHIEKCQTCIEFGLNTIDISYTMQPIGEDEFTCWVPLFRKAVIAQGWPIPARDVEIGIEIPFPIMVKLSGASHATNWNGGIIIKSFSNILVPIERNSRAVDAKALTGHNKQALVIDGEAQSETPDSIQWHLVLNINGNRIQYSDVDELCPNRLEIADLDFEAMENTRCFLGWWEKSILCLGSEFIAYEKIAYSTAVTPGKHLSIASASVGFSQWGQAIVNFKLGRKDLRFHVSQGSSFKRILEASEETPICLYDQSAQRAWLVNAQEVILNIMWTRHARRPYTVLGQNASLVAVDPLSSNSQSTEEVIVKMSGMTLHETEFEKIVFEEEFASIWSFLEPMIERAGRAADPNLGDISAFVKHFSKDKIQGWEYMDLVKATGTFSYKEEKIGSSHGGWLELVKDIGAAILFGANFGEVIKPLPVPRAPIPKLWVSLPPKHNFLATSVKMLHKIWENAGGETKLTPSGLYWLQATVLFGPCPCAKVDCFCPRVQQLKYKPKTTQKVMSQSGLQELNGCIIFGKAKSQDLC